MDAVASNQVNLKKEGLATITAEWDEIEGIDKDKCKQINYANDNQKLLLNYFAAFKMQMLILWGLVRFGLDRIGWFVKFLLFPCQQ